MDSLLAALALLMIIEGVLPFCAPSLWRETFRKMTGLSDGQLRFVGLVSILVGVTGLVLLRHA